MEFEGTRGNARASDARARVARWWAVVAAAATLGACASAPPTQVAERTDERTAVTVSTLPKPLLYSGAQGALGQPLDLALGPVEINRMGTKTWYLWAALLGGDLASGEPRLRLVSGGETLLDLAPAPAALQLPVSRRPYERPADWATERYFELGAADLARLQGRRDVRVEIVGAGGEAWRFEPWDGSSAALDAFVANQLQGRVASR